MSDLRRGLDKLQPPLIVYKLYDLTRSEWEDIFATYDRGVTIQAIYLFLKEFRPEFKYTQQSFRSVFYRRRAKYRKQPPLG